MSDQRAVVAGTRHSGASLSFVDLDHRALCRHAAGMFLARGHRRLAFISLDSGLAGDLESEEGFMEAIKSHGKGAEGWVIRHKGTPVEICKRVDACMDRRHTGRPTGFLVSKAYHALTVLGHLQKMGVSVPKEISIISRESESYLSYTIPEISRYEVSPELPARHLARALLAMIASGEATPTECRLMPQFVEGRTLGKISSAT